MTAEAEPAASLIGAAPALVPPPPRRFVPREDAGLWFLGWEIFFAPLTYFQRVQKVARGPRALQVSHLLQSFLVLAASQVLYLIAAAFVLRRVTGEPIKALFTFGWSWFVGGFAASYVASILWHLWNNWVDFPRNRLRHLYIALNRALIRSMMVANSGFFIGVGVATFRTGITGRVFQPSLVSFSFLGLAAGAAMRLTLGIIHFEPLLQADRQERFYLESWARRQNFCSVIVGLGLIALVVATYVLLYVGAKGVEGGTPTSRFGWVVLGYVGFILVVGGTITAWGFVFPMSFLIHHLRRLQHRQGRLSAVAALSRGPVAYDELFMVPAPGLGSLLRAVPRENPEQRSIEWLVFVLTQSYKRRTAAQAIANALDGGSIHAANLLAYLRNNRAWVDVPSLIAEYQQPSPTRTLFEHLSGPLALKDLHRLCGALESQASDHSLATPLVSVLQSLQDLLQAPTLEKWPWREGLHSPFEDPLHLALPLADLAAAKRASLQAPVHTSYAERSLALNRALNGVRQVREILIPDPWLGSLCEATLDRWIEGLHEQMSSVLSSAELEIYILSAPLQLDLEQEVRLTLTNRGPGRARDISVDLRAEETPAAHYLYSEVLAPRRRLDIMLSLRPGRTGPITGEVEVTFLDDLGETRRQLQPLELLVKGRVDAYRDFPNPFVVGPPLTDGKLFQGRRDLLRAFDEPPFPSLLIIGPRRMGKTSLLYQYRNMATSRARHSVFLDLQPLASETDVERLERRLVQALAPGTNVERLPEALERFLSCDARPALFIDESDFLPDIDRLLNGKLVAELRGALNREKPFQLVVATPLGFGSEEYLLLQQLFAMLHPFRLALLSGDEVARLLVDPLAEVLDVLLVAVERFVSFVGGHPYIAQLLASTVVSKAQERRQNLGDELLLENAAATVLEDLSSFFRVYQWNDLGLAEQNLLLLLAYRREPTQEELKAAPVLRDRCLVTSSMPPRIAMGLYERWLVDSFDEPLPFAPT